MRPYVSIRYLLILTAGMAIAMWRTMPLTGIGIVHTNKPLDVAIGGPGFFRLVDNDTCECLYTRSGRIQLSDDLDLHIEVNGKQYVIDPPIQVPKDTGRIEISEDGFLRVQTPTTSGIVGRFQIARFTTESPFDNPWQANAANGRSGIEQSCDPSVGAGLLKQGFLEVPPPSLRAIVTAIATAVFASVVVNLGSRHVNGNLIVRRRKPIFIGFKRMLRPIEV